MPAYWITFRNRSSGCVEADNETAALVAARVAGFGETVCLRYFHLTRATIITVQEPTS